MLHSRTREVVTILIGIVAALGLIAFYQWRVPKGRPVRVEAKIVAFESHFIKGLLRNTVFANVRLPDGRIVALSMPNDGLGCAPGDLVWLNKYDNGYEMADMRCRKA